MTTMPDLRVMTFTDMIVHAVRSNYDVAILISGDNDFGGAVQAVKDLGKNVEVVLFDAGSRHLREIADRVILVSRLSSS